MCSGGRKNGWAPQARSPASRSIFGPHAASTPHTPADEGRSDCLLGLIMDALNGLKFILCPVRLCGYATSHTSAAVTERLSVRRATVGSCVL